ncbi:FG-GAP repeat protein [Streptomyces sp. Ag109_O5-1]|uniref:FG-GAP-like repeat-containing protein n=1 Tax=Streptomyces sp. Ag109_O5-1 TaxID=1938851 RepID=UPI000FBEC5A9|nr:FG-GAP-like repeat-containing protein [Streptomyces sp. Ag109_O5-1]RPE42247.1 FG-GAP repeat protein [Streptomyces sp. Ag109_O5-1]
MRTRTRLRPCTLLLAAALTTGLLTALPVTTASAASAAPAKYADDFNGDGYRDLVTAAPGATVGGKARAGAVVVSYGSKSGIKASNRTVVTQDSAGIPGTAQTDGGFGSALAFGDLNRDGYADLVVSAERHGDDAYGGAVVIVWGGKNGLSGGRAVADPDRTSHDYFGRSLAVGDFTGDGRADLAVGSTGSDVQIFRGGFTRTGGAASRTWLDTDLEDGGVSGVACGGGACSLAAGDFNGDGIDDLVINGTYDSWNSSPTVSGNIVYQGASPTPEFERVLPTGGRHQVAVGDVNGDGHDDLIVSVTPGDVTGADGGSVRAYLGGPDGVSTTPQATITQDSPGVPGSSVGQNWFGDSLSVADVNGDGYADVAVGAPHEAVGAVRQAGTVTLLRGSAAGLTGVGATRYTQNTPGVPDSDENTDLFGSAVRLADLNGDHRADLAVGAQHENGGRGAVWSLRGSSSGLTTTGVVSFGATSVGVSGTGALLGSAFGQ